MEVHDLPPLADYEAPISPRKRVKLEEPLEKTMSDTADHVTSPVLANELDSSGGPMLSTTAASDFPTNESNVRDSQFRNTRKANLDTMEPTIVADNEALNAQVNKEAACGITEFVSPDLQGFTGIMKQRYTDFLVNEILPSGQVVHLDDTQAPKRGRKEKAYDGSRLPESMDPFADTHRDADWTAKSSANASMDGPDDLAPSDIKPEASTAPLDTTSTTYRQEIETKPGESEISNTSGHIENADSMKPDELASHLQLNPIATLAAPVAKSYDPPYNERPLTPPIPLSMQGYNVTPVKLTNIAPHNRIPPPSPSAPGDTPSPPKSARKKETVRIRQTSQGWIEVDEQKAKELEEDRGIENVGGATRAETASIEEPAKEAPLAAEEKIGHSAIPSTQASWQAYASANTADTEASAGFQLKPEDSTALRSYFSPNVVSDLLALYDRTTTSPYRKARDLGVVKSAVIDRQTRSKIHQDIRRIFNSRLESATDRDGAMIVTAMPEGPIFNGRNPVSDNHGYRGRGNRDRGRGRGRGGRDNRTHNGNHRVNKNDQWAELGGDYLHFSLYKENKDTMEAISWLVKQLNMKAAAFQFAGTKDRRGVTVQRVSVYRVFAERMIAAGRTLKNAKIGNFEYRPHPLQLGELTGNEFVITLRDCHFDYSMPVDSRELADTTRALVNKNITDLATHGFINYYGLQRFGTFSTSTDHVGLKMLQGDFEAAVNSVLQFDPVSLAAAQDPMSYTEDKVAKEHQARAYAINAFRTTENSHTALQDLPRKFSAESSIIRHLGARNNHNDFFGAIQAINRNMRLMYVHAYQSLVWNMVASERWRRFGATVVEGDLVLLDEHKSKGEPEIKQEDTDADGEAIVHPSADDRAVDPEDMFSRARALTKEEAEGGKYAIFDVVLPTPGYDIIYPANELGKFYEHFMGSEQRGGLDPHNMRRKWKDVSLSGSYRKVIAKPGKDFSCDVRFYYDEHEQFVETDLDRLEKARQERINAQHSHSAPLRDDPAKVQEMPEEIMDDTKDLKSEHEGNDSPIDTEPGGVSLVGDEHSGHKIAVILKLQLGSSQYATMALRELMKQGGARTYKQEYAGGR